MSEYREPAFDESAQTKLFNALRQVQRKRTLIPAEPTPLVMIPLPEWNAVLDASGLYDSGPWPQIMEGRLERDPYFGRPKGELDAAMKRRRTRG